MAKHIFYNAYMTVNSVDLSDHIESVSLDVETNEQFASAMSELEDYNMPGTKKVNNVQVTFYQDYATSKVYQTLYAAWTARTTFNLVARPDSGSAAATNPQWTIPVFVKKMPVMSGKRGDRHMAPVDFSVAGAVTISAP